MDVNTKTLHVKRVVAQNLWIVECDGVEYCLEAICTSNLNIPELIIYESDQQIFKRD